VSDTAAPFQALEGGWWNRVDPPAPEQKLDVATGQSTPVVDNGNWLSVVTGKAPWNRAEAPAPEQKSAVANAQSTPPKDGGTPDVADLSQPLSTADNQSQVEAANLAGEGSKP
jgi:hypothetical protein